MAMDQKGLHPWCVEIVAETLRREIVALARHPSFGNFNCDTQTIGKDVEARISGAIEATVEKAPTWLCIINTSGNSRRSNQTIRMTAEMNHQTAKDTILVFSRLCQLLQARKSDGIPALLGIYLYEGGAKTRTIDTFSRLGLCLTSKVVLKRIHALEKAAEQSVRELGRDPSSVVTWDNFEFREGRRGERTGDQAQFRSITTAMITQNRCEDSRPLKSSDWQPECFPLSASKILSRINGSRIPSQVSYKQLTLAIALTPYRLDYSSWSRVSKIW